MKHDLPGSSHVLGLLSKASRTTSLFLPLFLLIGNECFLKLKPLYESKIYFKYSEDPFVERCLVWSD